ncbi:hypothetical protein [Bartonella sp. F02]|uniref:hypothetical protein n=1 Tax=Bartonella sp. F02 TaxID=2967262 RepID=UPI0022A99D3F|nr:hypothetical protein [Bartonella sp. F02]MCZ2328306.1 hypothetical protein [Bartonella sp. F02]
MVAQKRRTSTLKVVDHFSYSAKRLLDIHAMLLKVKKENRDNNPDLLYQLDATKKQLDEISYALILEYRKRQENERSLKQILLSISDQLFSLNHDFKENSRLFFQEIRMLQSQIQYFSTVEQKKCAFNEQDSSYFPSKIDEIIKQLQKARENLILENPHLFEKEL